MKFASLIVGIIAADTLTSTNGVKPICSLRNLTTNLATEELISRAPYDTATGFVQFQEGLGFVLGSTTELIAEASDAKATGFPIADGKNGNTNFPHGKLKTLVTVGERSICEESLSEIYVGVPDGVGAYLADDDTVRIIVQSESYGPLVYYSYPFVVNGITLITGSHIQYIDYDRRLMADFMTSTKRASSMITGFGQMIQTAYNLKGDLVQPRNKTAGARSPAPLYSNTDKDGVYAVAVEITDESDWFYQSFCSAHLEEKEQWGRGLGLVDDIFITNEEWNSYKANTQFVGLSAHVLDLATKKFYAAGVFTNGGFEKIIELNPQHPEYVIFAVSGYNGDFGLSGNQYAPLVERNLLYKRPDGKPYVWTRDLHPHRIYVGVKGRTELGQPAPADDFLARNGLKYGQMYGYAVDMSPTGPTRGLFRDPFHASNLTNNGAFVPGKWIAQPWRWNGTVTNFAHDGSWDYQLPTGVAGFTWWNTEGLDRGGCKCEHASPDPRVGITGFIQGSTCGYFGHYYVNNVPGVLAAAAATGGKLPTSFDGSYYVYQGSKRDVTKQIILGGEGRLENGKNATYNWDAAAYGSGNSTIGRVAFEDIDGLEVLEAPNGLYVIIQEDSTSVLGDRMLIAKLEHENDGKELTYYFVAQSGGSRNSRGVAKAYIPKGASGEPQAHEFSGIFDLSGLLRRVNGKFALKASHSGSVKRSNDRQVAINDKQLIINLQAHSIQGGLISGFRADRGGQIYMYQPNIPV